MCPERAGYMVKYTFLGTTSQHVRKHISMKIGKVAYNKENIMLVKMYGHQFVNENSIGPHITNIIKYPRPPNVV